MRRSLIAPDTVDLNSRFFFLFFFGPSKRMKQVIHNILHINALFVYWYRHSCLYAFVDVNVRLVHFKMNLSPIETKQQQQKNRGRNKRRKKQSNLFLSSFFLKCVYYSNFVRHYDNVSRWYRWTVGRGLVHIANHPKKRETSDSRPRPI